MRLIRILRIGVGTTLLLLLLSLQLVSAQNENEIEAAWQPFTGGVLIWIEDTDQIYVLINNGYVNNSNNTLPKGRYRVYDNDFDGTAYPDPHREGGCWNVRRGFKVVLNQHPGLAGEDGPFACAMAAEIGYGEPNGRAVITGIATDRTFIIYGPGNTEYVLDDDTHEFATRTIR